MTDNHRKPRLPPVSCDQDLVDRIDEIANHIGLPASFVIRRLLEEGIEKVDLDALPSNVLSLRLRTDST